MSFPTGPSGAIKSGTVVVPGKSWKLTPKGNNKDVSNFRDGRKRIPGLIDAEGTIEIPIDIAAAPYQQGGTAANLLPSSVVALTLTLTTGKDFTLSAIIDEVNPAQDVDGNPTYEVKFSLESGSVTYPT